MAAKIVERQEEALGEGEVITELDTQSTVAPEASRPTAAPTAQPVTPEEDDDLPEKYRGKSLKEIAKMHQEAERLAGRQSGEVGELRKAVDQLIQTQLNTNAQPDEEEVDFFADPEAAMARAIANHPTVKAAGEVSIQARKQQVLAALERKHPDMNELLSKPEFGEWVSASPVRQRLMREAHTNYDAEAADELFTLYKERQAIAQQTLKVDQQERKAAAKSASTGDVRGQAPTQSKKYYRRADIINLMRNDPDRYAALADEIMLAYKEKRVRS